MTTEVKPLEDRIEEAHRLGESDARSGVPMPNPYTGGTPENTAWKSGYDSTPKGVPSRTHDADLMGVMKAGGGWDALVVDPYTALLASAKRQGRQAREGDQPIGANPYNAPESRLEGPAEAWAAGWREFDAERQKVKRESEVQTLTVPGNPTGGTVRFLGTEIVRTERVTREAVALAMYEHWLYKAQDEKKGAESETEWAARWAVQSADDLLAALRK